MLNEHQIQMLPERIYQRLIAINTDNPSYKNSVITFMKIDDKEWKRLIKNKNVLYKKE